MLPPEIEVSGDCPSPERATDGLIDPHEGRGVDSAPSCLELRQRTEAVLERERT
jgi:hypothetical protein